MIRICLEIHIDGKDNIVKDAVKGCDNIWMIYSIG